MRTSQWHPPLSAPHSSITFHQDPPFLERSGTDILLGTLLPSLPQLAVLVKMDALRDQIASLVGLHRASVSHSPFTTCKASAQMCSMDNSVISRIRVTAYAAVLRFACPPLFCAATRPPDGYFLRRSSLDWYPLHLYKPFQRVSESPVHVTAVTGADLGSWNPGHAWVFVYGCLQALI